MYAEVIVKKEVMTAKGGIKKVREYYLVEDVVLEGVVARRGELFGDSAQVTKYAEVDRDIEVLERNEDKESIYTAKFYTIIDDGDKVVKSPKYMFCWADSLREALDIFEAQLTQGYEMVASSVTESKYSDIITIG